MATKYPITPQRKKELEKRLNYLKDVKLKEVNKEIKYFRSFCNFSEDTPFDETLDQQFAIKEQIQEIEEILKNSELIQTKNAHTKIILGSKITFKELPNGELETYTLVSPIEANPIEYRISIKSPIGKSLIGHKEKEIVPIATPAGKIQVKIMNVE